MFLKTGSRRAIMPNQVWYMEHRYLTALWAQLIVYIMVGPVGNGIAASRCPKQRLGHVRQLLTPALL
jgi:hypothetical protein